MGPGTQKAESGTEQTLWTWRPEGEHWLQKILPQAAASGAMANQAPVADTRGASFSQATDSREPAQAAGICVLSAEKPR